MALIFAFLRAPDKTGQHGVLQTFPKLLEKVTPVGYVHLVPVRVAKIGTVVPGTVVSALSRCPFIDAARAETGLVG
jgi:hypothetical protein